MACYYVIRNQFSFHFDLELLVISATYDKSHLVKRTADKSTNCWQTGRKYTTAGRYVKIKSNINTNAIASANFIGAIIVCLDLVSLGYKLLQIRRQLALS